MKTPLLMAVVLLLPLYLSACNTVQGAGEDISRGGEAIEESAR